MNRSETSFWYLDRENYLQWSEEAGLKVFTHQDTRDPQLSSDEGEDQQKQKSRRLHALLQYFFNSMMANQLSVVIPVSDD